jgi:hypothetical protein
MKKLLLIVLLFAQPCFAGISTYSALDFNNCREWWLEGGADGDVKDDKSLSDASSYIELKKIRNVLAGSQVRAGSKIPENESPEKQRVVCSETYTDQTLEIECYGDADRPLSGSVYRGSLQTRKTFVCVRGCERSVAKKIYYTGEHNPEYKTDLAKFNKKCANKK